jgi:UDP-N-acetylmuramoyl-tripeptide--D-alanyl-D-alanine ligase
MQVDELYNIFCKHPSIQTDTRKLKSGDLFFALKGPNYNGNEFANEALEKGASFVITDEKTSSSRDRLIHVENVLTALQQLSKFHRQQFSIPFVAITGSNGKTTTKELLHAVLSTSYLTYTTEGNLNNHIGIPLTILKIKPDAEIAVIEMGANHLKEIESYCQYALPTHGLITNIGKAHLEGFGGIENVKKGKGELFDYLKAHNGTVFVNTTDKAIEELSKNINNKVNYGSNDDSRIITSDPFLEINIDGIKNINIKTNLVGAYNFINVLAAVCIGRFFKVPDEKIKSAIENYSPSNSRSQLIQKESNTIILDAYNANPGSMKAAIENFAAIKSDKKILLLGSMMELGTESEKEHEAIIGLIDKYKWEDVVLVGSNFRNVKHNYINYDNALQVRDWLHRQHVQNAHILIKGSRSMQMEKVLE